MIKFMPGQCFGLYRSAFYIGTCLFAEGEACFSKYHNDELSSTSLWLLYSESGHMKIGLVSKALPFQKQYLYECTMDGQKVLRIHNLDTPNSVLCDFTLPEYAHSCIQDVYRSEILYDSNKDISWTLTFHVNGPNKEYSIITQYSIISK